MVTVNEHNNLSGISKFDLNVILSREFFPV